LPRFADGGEGGVPRV